MNQELVANIEDNELTLVPDLFLENSCPFLGVQDDPGTPMGYPTPDNRCYAFKPALHVDLKKQRRHCLSDCYAECLYFQQQTAETPAENDGAYQSPGFSRRFVNGRTLALGMMLILILLAVLIWWPPPGASMDEGTVFGDSSSLNSLGNGIEGLDSADRTSGSQAESEVEDSSPAAASSESLQGAPAAPDLEIEEKVSESKEFSTEQSFAQGAALNATTEEAENLLEEPSSPPDIQDARPELEETVAVTPIPENAGSDRPGQGRADLPPVAGTEEGSSDNNAFSPIAYEEQESGEEILNIHQEPGSENYVRIARPELFDLIGRDETGDWIKISTGSGIEGWVRVSDTGLGSWITKLPQIGP
jgi:hypothetical protein